MFILHYLIKIIEDTCTYVSTLDLFCVCEVLREADKTTGKKDTASAMTGLGQESHLGMIHAVEQLPPNDKQCYGFYYSGAVGSLLL